VRRPNGPQGLGIDHHTVGHDTTTQPEKIDAPEFAGACLFTFAGSVYMGIAFPLSEVVPVASRASCVENQNRRQTYPK
jgi:hypothetical protein